MRVAVNEDVALMFFVGQVHWLVGGLVNGWLVDDSARVHVHAMSTTFPVARSRTSTRAAWRFGGILLLSIVRAVCARVCAHIQHRQCVGVPSRAHSAFGTVNMHISND